MRQRLKIPSGERHELCRALHAEQNALIQASLYGISVAGSTLYATNQPCLICAKMLINAGIKEIVIAAGYPDEMAMEFLMAAKIKLRKVG
jgi:dCMP deaminase